MFALPLKNTYWKALLELADERARVTISELFEEDSDRVAKFTLRAGPLLLDYSKQRLSPEALNLLLKLSEASDLESWIARLFSDELINHTEQRAAKHWALRDVTSASEDATAVRNALSRMAALAERIQEQEWRGYTGEPITDVVNLGVGGSELGPLLVTKALEEWSVSNCPRVHFVSTMDGSQISSLLPSLRPQSTLFVISSKSFTTVDTLYNAQTAREWLQAAMGESAAVTACHFIGVSASPEKMTAWGIPEENQLLLWDWVGGRFSLWSTIGLPIVLTTGFDRFSELLDGARWMDNHFRAADFSKNLPVLLALIGVWNSNFLNIRSHAVLPYDGRLEYLPSFLTQLEMESNGKAVNRDGQWVKYHTCPVIWGEVGSNAQHAFYQLLHQGTEFVSSDFILASRRTPPGHKESAGLREQHLLSVANCIAQSQLLAFGHQNSETDPILSINRTYRGNQPSSTLLMDELNPFSLGALLAAYEHKVFVQSVIWEINPFDQWGVEKGKELAGKTQQWLKGGGLPEGQDPSTTFLISRVLQG